MTLPTEIIPSDASTLLDTSKQADCLLLDCRTEEEYSIAKLAQSKLIPMQEIPGRLAELEPWKQKRLVVHCHHGVRSLRVAKWLREHGFDNAQSLKGGIEAWRNEIDSSIPAY
ncbi:MAG TPA: rhodanese [Planctomycetaceae bacterium]|nr:rhodanese [Planctomycetaceae bacterium]